MPVTLRFKSNLLFVYFKSEYAEVPGPGFNLTYEHVAVVNITTTTEGKAKIVQDLYSVSAYHLYKFLYDFLHKELFE